MHKSNLQQEQHLQHLKQRILEQEDLQNEQDAELPQPQNSNHLSTAPLKDKFLINSSYLAAEIPLKLGHFMSNLWVSGTELSSSLFIQQQRPCEGDEENMIWLLGRSYTLKPLDKMEQDILDAQNDEMFRPQSNLPEEQEQEHQQQHDDAMLWPPDFYEDFTSRLWMTYRHNYPPIRPSNHKTDIGWGCMLRSGQSLLANTLLIHFLSRDWRRQKQTQTERQLYGKIIHWFLDELSSRAPFSIHRIALLGKQLGKNIGEWFGPSTISQVIQALVSDFQPAQLSVYVATDGVIYTDDVQDLVSGKHPKRDLTREVLTVADEEAKSLYDSSNAPDEEIINQYQTEKSFKSVLILIPLRLGIDSLHPTYFPALKACFELPSFVGIAGGKPNSSLYFMGLEGNDLIYLDPHFSRSALETKSLKNYTRDDFSTYHCQTPRRINIAQLDPSMMLGFYCRNQHDFDLFCEQIKLISQKCSPLFCIQKSAPEYDDNVYNENDFGIVSDEDEQYAKEDDSDDNSIF